MGTSALPLPPFAASLALAAGAARSNDDANARAPMPPTHAFTALHNRYNRYTATVYNTLLPNVEAVSKL
jgi:hypothetical protein